MTDKLMKIGILVCGHLPPELLDKYRGYDYMFQNLLGEDTFEYLSFDVLENEIPEQASVADGWLITGSKHGVYEDHPWIPPLENLLRDAYRQQLPIIGVCFGHQILAQALGGTVEKFSGGWAVGHVEYSLENQQKYAAVNAFHQDQIIKLPENATSYGSNDFCQYAFVNYGDTAMSMQPHPEFDDEFLADLLDTRGGILPPEIRTQARENLGKPLTSQVIGEQMKAFFLKAGS